jgi:hypothetical protein
MYRLTINGKPYGRAYASESAVTAAMVRMMNCFHGVGWVQEA